MKEEQPRRLPEEVVTPTPKPNGALATHNEFIDQILIFQGVTPTEANRQNLQGKINSISEHRN